MMGKSVDLIDLADGASLRDFLEVYESGKPRLKESLSSLALAVNQQYAGPDTKLRENDEIALLPPVSGGAPEAAGGKPSPSTSLRAGSQPAGRRRYAFIVREAIDTPQSVAGLKRGGEGAALAFGGGVRSQTRGRKTLYLDYEAYEEMALEQMESLAVQAVERFQIRDVAIVHRLGRLEIGETSVLIAVASAHRAAAFVACRWLIDTLKRTVPIWKKEYFEDGAGWAGGGPFPVKIPRANW